MSSGSSTNCLVDVYTTTTYQGGSDIKKNGTNVQIPLAAFNGGDLIGVAFDADNLTMNFYRNNVAFGTQVTGLTAGTYIPVLTLVSSDGAGNRPIVDVNFGQQPFTYTPPTGYKGVNTFNLPDSTIKAGAANMDAALYAGTNATRTVTNSSAFQPDFVWIKNRSTGTNFHMLFDSVRGVGKSLYSNATTQEGTNPSSGYLSAFATNGFTVTAGASSSDDVNGSGYNYVGWQWKAGQGTTSSNTSGSITSTVSVNTSAGFSIVTYTGNGTSGATVGHGLGVAPKFIIFKTRNLTGYNWIAYHSALGATQVSFLSSNIASAANTYLNNTTPSSSVITLGSVTNNNDATGTYVAYCWSEIAGFSKMGSYTGNGSTDGPFVYTGFRPKFILTKRTDATSDWWIQDTSRATYNASNAILFPNLANAEYTTAGVEFDILSNGFKPRNTGHNISGGTYIYMAFAESPFKNSLAR